MNIILITMEEEKRTICFVKTLLPTREEMLTLMKGSLFVQMEEDGIEERDDSVKDLVIIILMLLVTVNVMLLVVLMTVIMVMVMVMVMGTAMIGFESASPLSKSMSSSRWTSP